MHCTFDGYAFNQGRYDREKDADILLFTHMLSQKCDDDK
jgi:hypothetical protein